MNKQRFPSGWNEERVQRLIETHESQSEAGAVAEDEATLADSNQTFMEIPSALVPAVQELIGKAEKVA